MSREKLSKRLLHFIWWNRTRRFSKWKAMVEARLVAAGWKRTTPKEPAK